MIDLVLFFLYFLSVIFSLLLAITYVILDFRNSYKKNSYITFNSSYRLDAIGCLFLALIPCLNLIFSFIFCMEIIRFIFGFSVGQFIDDMFTKIFTIGIKK